MGNAKAYGSRVGRRNSTHAFFVYQGKRLLLTKIAESKGAEEAKKLLPKRIGELIMKYYFAFVVILFAILFNSCKPNDGTGITISNRTNASVVITNERTGEVLNKVSDDTNIVQNISIGEHDLSDPEMVIHEGDILRISYYPHSRFKDFSVSMSVRLFGAEVCKKTNSPYEVSYEVGPTISKGIGNLVVVGTYGNIGDDYYLYETRSVKVKVE